MDPAYYVAAGSLKARAMQLEAVSNNLANVATTGFKPERTFFATFNKAKASSRNLPNTPYVNEGTVVGGRGFDFRQGPLQTTGHALDLALEGEGFFALQTPQGVRVTRAGHFTTGANGQIQTSDGALLLGKNGRPLQIDPAGEKIQVGRDGTISQGAGVVGQIDVRTYENTLPLTAAGNTRFDPANAQATQSSATVVQGSLEQSGVDMASALVDMIRLNRLYEMSLKVASTLSNDLDARAISDIAMQR